MALSTFGHVGTARADNLFASRHELTERGQHRPLRAGGATAQHGAESIILADQYEDDEVHTTTSGTPATAGATPKPAARPTTRT